MLKTINESREEVTALIRTYAAWKRHDVEQILKSKDAPSRLQLEILSGQASEYARRARVLLAAKATSDADEVDDLTAIAEELELVAEEGAAESNPDAIWATADDRTKRRLTQQIPIRREVADKIRARARGDLRKQNPPKKP